MIEKGLAVTKKHNQSGAALLIVLMAILLLSGLGLSLALTTSAETSIATNYRVGLEGFYAVDAGLERALQDLLVLADWDTVLVGGARSGFVDGAPSGERTLADGSRIDLGQVVNQANCGRNTSCTVGQMDAITADRPWGSNNPRWQLYAHAPLSRLLSDVRLPWLYYAVVMVADDPLETDGDPMRDELVVSNPGAGILSVRAEAFGPRGAHHVVEATLARVDPLSDPSVERGPLVRLLSWRLIR